MRNKKKQNKKKVVTQPETTTKVKVINKVTTDEPCHISPPGGASEKDTIGS